MDPKIPSRNPLSYCRLCLSQVNLLTVLESPDDANLSPMKEVMQKLHQYTRIALVTPEDFPSAICGVCRNQLAEFHEFRRNVVRNHNAVRIFRRTFGDEIERVKVEEDDEEGEEVQYVEIIEDPQLVDIIREEYGTTELKEVDVYHVNGELRTVVVKAEPEESPPSQQQLPTVNQVSPKKTPSVNINPSKKTPSIQILNKAGGPVLPTAKLQQNRIINTPPTTQSPQNRVINTTPTEKSPQTRLINPTPTEKSPQTRIINTTPTATAFTVYKCLHCRAVFQSQDNLVIHERTDHPKQPKQPPPREPTQIVVHKPSPPKRPHQPPPNKVLFKCTSCSSSFVQEQNLKQHQITCKPAALSRLDLSQITIKRTKIQEQPPQRIQCPNCPLNYKSKYYLDKHLLNVHKISPLPNQQQHYCTLCGLNYSCPQDLQLHNRALHPFLCMTCNGDFRECMHRQPSVRESDENGAANKV